jgi:hypothetical protein
MIQFMPSRKISNVDRTTLDTSLKEHIIEPRPRGGQEGGLHSLRAGTSIAR